MTAPVPQVRPQAEIAEWLINQLSVQLEISAAEIDPDESVTTLGIDSMQYIGLIGELEEWIGCRFADNPLPDYPTINGLSKLVAGQLEQGRTIIDTLPQ